MDLSRGVKRKKEKCRARNRRCNRLERSSSVRAREEIINENTDYDYEHRFAEHERDKKRLCMRQLLIAKIKQGELTLFCFPPFCEREGKRLNCKQKLTGLKLFSRQDAETRRKQK